MLTAIIIITVLVLLAALYIFLIMPDNSQKDECRKFMNHDYAHRGLFNSYSGIPENSLEAFRLAVENGCGIELDIQMTRDKQLVVFHDATLKRMCGDNASISEKTYRELSAYRLEDTEYTIPLLTDVLDLVNGQVPLLIEIKLTGHETLICKVLTETIRSYRGLLCIESFNPLVLKWFRENYPALARGQLSCRFNKNDGTNFFLRFAAEYLLCNVIGRPNFISYNQLQAKNPSLRICRKLFHTPTFGWTVKSQRAYNKAIEHFDVLIFDSFIPEK